MRVTIVGAEIVRVKKSRKKQMAPMAGPSASSAEIGFTIQRALGSARSAAPT